MKRLNTLLLLLVIFLSACNSNKFTTRKYTSGRYVSHVAKPKTVSPDLSKNNTPARKEAGVGTNKRHLPLAEAQTDSKQELAKHPVIATSDQGTVKTEKNSLLALGERSQTKSLSKLKVFKALPIPSKNESFQKSGKAEKAPDDKSTVGVILSAIGILLDVTGIYVAVFTLQYFFLAFTIAGFALGLIGLLFGIDGMAKYKKEKSAGTKYTTTLVMSIISMALGGGAMILGLIYSLFGLLIVSF
ncbi:MAG: hypothetical protein JNL60_16795 [Bacteroidia bacterium]|nr:hypothetical protein [Bacteroidia bacterium]